MGNKETRVYNRNRT